MPCRGKDEARIVTTNCEKSAEAIVLERGRAERSVWSMREVTRAGLIGCGRNVNMRSNIQLTSHEVKTITLGHGYSGLEQKKEAIHVIAPSLTEPPDAERHVRWCGRGWATSPYPIAVLCPGSVRFAYVDRVLTVQ